MAIVYTKRMLVERLRRHIANGFPNSDFPISENEVLLYIDAALATVAKQLTYEGAKLEGVLDVADGWLATWQLTLTQDIITGYWYGTLPQSPVSLPMGYNITDAYFADSTNGRGIPINLIKAKRRAYRDNLPKPLSVQAWVEGSKIWFQASDGSSLINKTPFIQMISTRSKTLDDVIYAPEDAIELVFVKVETMMKERMGLPKDIISDNLPSGNKTS